MADNSTGPSSAGVASDQVQSLIIDVRANTQGFAQDLSAMRGTFNSTLVDGFTQAGSTLEAGLASAIQKGSSGFAALRTTALGAINDIATQATGTLFSAVGADSGGGAMTGLLGLTGLVGALSGLSGLPGRAIGGPVSPGQPYMVGENGPELFVPASAGAVANGQQIAGGGGRDVRVSINVTTPAGGDVPQALQRSGRQIASAVRRAVGGY